MTFAQVKTIIELVDLELKRLETHKAELQKLLNDLFDERDKIKKTTSE